MIDNFRHKGLRKNLIDELRGKGITNEEVLKVIEQIPRHWFIHDNAFLPYAYDDIAFPIGAGQTISQPYTVAFQTSLLEIKPRDKVLEIGTGCGYQTAVLLSVGAKVFTIERQRELYLKTRDHLPTIGYRAKFFYGDGYKGNKSFAPYDKILVTCGAPYVPEDLLKQLKIGGYLVIPVGPADEAQTMIRITKVEEGKFEQEEYGDFRFVPMLEDKQ